MMLWLWEVLADLAAAVARGDKSWWPFVSSVLATTAVIIGLAIWLT